MTTKIIPSPWRYILPRHKESDYADSIVIGIVGPKRSGKSLLLAKLLYRDMCYGRKVWSTMDVKTPKFYLDKGFPMINTKPVDWDAFFMMSTEYQNGTIGLDEASSFNSNRSPLSSRNRITNAFTNQVGHRSIDVFWTAKSTGWLDRQGLGFETDIEIECKDMAKTRWGRKNHVKKGKLIYLEAWDRSGALTGRVADRRDRYARPFKRWYWPTCEHYWDAYDTRYLLGVEDIFGGVKLDLQKRIISNKTRFKDYEAPLYEIACQMAQSQNLVSCDSFWNVAEATGITGDSRQLGRCLKGMGIVRKQKANGYFYDLSGLTEQGT